MESKNSASLRPGHALVTGSKINRVFLGAGGTGDVWDEVCPGVEATGAEVAGVAGAKRRYSLTRVVT